MQSNTVVLQGTSYPICLVAGKGQTPSGYAPAVANTPQSAKQQIAEIGGALTSDAAKRLDVINLLNSAGVGCPRSASARETASALTQALIAGAVTCYHQKAKSAIQVSDNTNSGAAGKKSSNKSSSTASGKSAAQAPAKNTGGASNNTASEEPITNQECRSDPVSMLSGEEILPLIDFTLAGSRQLVWRRLYRSSHADVCTTMGNGWRHDFMASLTEHYLPPPKVGPKQKGTYWLEYQDEHGAKHKFEKVKPGQSSYQLSSNLALHYQTNGKQVLVTPDDQHLTFKPGESAWLLEKIINEKGQSIALYYDAKERLHRIEVNKVRGCIISYNAQGLLSKIAAYCTDKNNKQQLLSPLLASYEYDENKNLVESTNQQNETERYAYNAANLLTKRTRASGFSHHFEWDSYSPSAKCIKQWGDNNTYTYQFEYNSEAGETTCIDSRGHKEHFVHNAQGKLVKHTDPNGNVWQYTYNAQGQKLSEIKPDSSTTRYSYTPFGQLETLTQPDGNQTHFAYNQLGQRVLTTLPDGQTITRKYSVAGLLQSETFGDGRTTLYSYDKLGQLTQHINKNGQITKFIWNEQGELLAKHYNDELIRYSYDSLGRVNATLNNAGLLTQYKYNEHGQLTQTIAFDEKEPENKQHQYFSYDEAGRLISSQNSKGDTTEQHFEGLSQPHCVIQPDGSALHLTYDKERNLTAIERSDGHVYRISYDANENPTQITGFDGTLQQYKYDACNRLTSVTQSNKRHVKIERDSLGRVTAQHASLASDSHIINNANYYSYTKQGNIARAHNAQSTLKQRFDKGGRLLCAEQVNNQQQAHTLKYSYDEYGRRQTLTLPDSTTLKYSYNQFGQLSGINLLQTNSKEVELAQPLVTLSYDSQGNIKTQQFGNSITLNQQFDVFNRLTQQQLTHPAQTLFDTCTYNYDSVNQLIARKNEGVSSQNINFEYNSLGQLIQQTLASSRTDTTTHYQWDSFGNPQSQTVQSNTSDADLRDIGEQGAKNKAASNEHTASSSIDLTHATHSEYNELVPNGSESSSKNSSNADSVANNESTNNTTINSATDADRLIQFGDSDFYYDEFGNQIRETGKGIKTRREYNAFNQLSCFNNNGTLTQYDYDPLGRRIAKHTEHGKIDYIWDNDQLIGECQHGEYTWYINLPNQFHPVALIKQGEVYYYHLDQLNTPRFVTNNKAEVVWENQADVYGYEESESEPKASAENSFTQPIRFQGQYLDEESGLHYNRYRYYSPKQQRFINQDPIGLVGGINHYQYAPNPVNWVDPFGLMCEEGEKSLKEALEISVASGTISGELSDKLLQSAYDGNLTPKDIKEHLGSLTTPSTPIRWIPPSVLDNKLGAGGYKEALAIDDEEVLLIPKRNSTNMNPATIEDIKQEASILEEIKALGLPVVTIPEFGSTITPGGSIIQGGIQERMLFNGRDITKETIQDNEAQGFAKDNLAAVLSQKSLDELERIYEIFEEKNIFVKDLQFMYGADGLPKIADPQEVIVGAPHDIVDESLNDIAKEYRLISKASEPEPIQKAKPNSEQDALLLVSQLKSPDKDNYNVYTNHKGNVIVSRKDKKQSAKLRYENGALVEANDKIDIFHNVDEKLTLDHEQLTPADKEKLKKCADKRDEAVKARNEALDMEEGSEREQALKNARSDMRNASEELGEAASKAYIMHEYPNAIPLESNLPGDGKQGQFDQVYLIDGKPPEVIIVEAKGGASDWSSRMADKKRAQQGSSEYMESVIQNYTKKLENLQNPEKNPAYGQAGKEELTKQIKDCKKNLRAIQKAQKYSRVNAKLSPPKAPVIKYIGIKQKANDSGMKKSIEVTKFKVKV